ncbi:MULTISPECIES: GyrI-like domain-containing protein [unclassified Lactococcus]|uniref:GyrI-like domain-containing protein n=1 Tax=unclassified Lactococcus TaxID=2643510 RepID=UPI0011CAD033|nr:MULTISPECIES: GyrI-like domain-containing protein [unclassified Lactococcus]MQW23384.1 hypothetical protein [Lactococcus sp. dk101]TXK37916.1 hypothetical protein FVP42_06955 [Lactococcus sp. dk310]TXK49570.1 hypothetical protein FVP43_06925 [Lactococcus sp. dk322]
MSEYQLIHHGAFRLVGYGFTIQSNFQEMEALKAEKENFWQGLKSDGRFDQLKKIAKDEREWSVNEVYQGKPWNYFAVQTSKIPTDITRIIEFPESDYIVVAGEGAKDELFDELTYRAFSSVLTTITDYAYIGGPNATFRVQNEDGNYSGEFWVPVVKK